ncbi:MAG: hypothetical protein EA351_10575, partial [Gemmatimonadales bacterium]
MSDDVTQDPPAGVERRFLGWDAPALERAAGLIRGGAAETGGEGAVPLVVVPGQRAGRLLLERLVGLAEARGATLRPPEIVSQGGLPERLYQAEMPAPDPILERLVWMVALQRTPARSLEALLPEPPESGDDAGWDALEGTILTLHRELGAEGLT